MDNSEIKNFFKDQTIFITGGTGFLGKILIEKLLRVCDVRKIFVLVRPKKGKTAEERFNSFFNYACFDNIRSQESDLRKKICFINGDCALSGLGITEKEKLAIIEKTTIVFHAAANVKFDQPLQVATETNVRATIDVLGLARSMPNLKVFVYVSTAFSHCPRSEIDEQFYNPPMTHLQLLNLTRTMNEDLLTQLTSTLIGQWPNTYTFSKAIAEDVIKREGQGLPITIVRPAIVSSTVTEPTPGWIDNLYGLSGIVFAMSLGVLRSIHGKKSVQLQAVPCDYVANAVLAAAWDTSRERPVEIPIYNYVGPVSNKITLGSGVRYMKKYIEKYPTQKMVWHVTCEVRENPLWHKVCVFFYHTLVAYLIDFLLIGIGREAIAVKNYERINNLLNLTSYFGLKEWTFGHKNLENLWHKMNDTDKKIFQFNIEKIDWEEYIKNSVKYGRIHIVKEPFDTIPQAKRKYQILRVLHYAFLLILYMLLYTLFMHILRLFW